MGGLMSPSAKVPMLHHPPSSAFAAIGSHQFHSPEREFRGEVFLNNLQPINILPNAEEFDQLLSDDLSSVAPYPQPEFEDILSEYVSHQRTRHTTAAPGNL